MNINIVKLLGISLTIFVFVLLVGNYTFIGGQHGEPIDEIDPNIQWEFFEKEILQPKQAKEAYGSGEKITFPHIFNNEYGSEKMYGTYVAKTKLPKSEDTENIAIYVPFEYGSYNLFVDDQLLAKNGVVGTTKVEQVPENAPKIGQVHSKEQEVYITLQLSNFYSVRGGFSIPLYIGQFSELVKEHNSSIIFHFFINGIIFVASICSLLIGIFDNRNKRMILFATFCFVIALRSVFARPFLYSITIFDIPWQLAVKIEAICTVLAFSVAITFLVNYIFPSLNKRLFWAAQTLLAIQLMLIIFFEPIIFQKTFAYTLSLSLVLLMFMIFKSLSGVNALTIDNNVHFVGIIVLFMATIHDLIVVHKILHISLLVQHSQAIYVMLISVVICWEYAQKQKEQQRLKDEILALNASLDLKIKERTVQLEEANEMLQHLATKDALTGIANRYAFDHHLELYFEQAVNNKTNLSLLIIDLDYFKKYNDQYGHIMGDTLLHNVVTIIDKHLPTEALFARYGGEEFAIIYPGANEEQLTQLGYKIVEAVANKRFEHCQHPDKYVTISAGGYTMTAKDLFTSPKQLIKASDERLYVAKRNGRNQYVGNNIGVLNTI